MERWRFTTIKHNFKMIEITVEVSQKTTFQELPKTANLHPSLHSTSIVSI